MESDVIIEKYDESYIRVLSSRSIALEMKEEFSFLVPDYQYHPKYKAGFWDGRINLFNLKTRLLYAGLSYKVEEFCRERDYTFEYSYDNAADPFSLKEAATFWKSIDIPEKFEMRDYQLKSFAHCIRNKRCIQLSPTGSGKSLIIYLVLRYLNLKSLIIVPTVNLVNQMSSDFIDYGYKDEIHKIFSGQEKHSNEKITISTWQSIYKMPEEYFNEFDVVVVDEVHRAKAKSLTDIMIRMNQTQYKFGFTGTLDESLTNKMVLEGLFGKVERFVTTSDLIEDGTLSELKIKCITLDWSEDSCKEVKNMEYPDEIKWLENNSRRNNFIKNLALSLKGNTLLLFHHQEHGERLYDLLNSEVEDRHTYLVYGKTDVEEREEIRKIINEEEDSLIFASFYTFSEGVNIPNLRNTILAFPVQKKVRILQSIGRGLRKSETKDKHTLFDIIDNLKWKKKENYALKHFMKRHENYLSEGFPVKYYKVKIR